MYSPHSQQLNLFPAELDLKFLNMHYAFVSAAVVASAGLTLAAPAGPPTNQHFQITQVPRGQVFKSGPYQMLKTYGKYAKVGAVAPARVQEAAAAVQSGSVSANPQQFDQAYLSPVTVGGKTLELDFDTGSADLWVFSTLMPSSEQSGHVVYNPSTSGRKLQGSTWNISYGDGSGASGTVYADKVVVGSVTATSQAVEAATSVSAQFAQDEDNDVRQVTFDISRTGGLSLI